MAREDNGDGAALRAARDRLDRLAREIDEARADLHSLGAVSSAPEADAGPLLEAFYHLLEERYRGSRREIRDRLSIYRPDLRAARDRTGGLGLAVDLGCGRGELLEVMGQEGLRAVGIDQNRTQLRAARERGLNVEEGDALAFLRDLPDGSASVVSAIHLIEHLPFPILLLLLAEIARVLAPGGLVILETPNPRNLIVGATTFHFDPTHLKPLPFEVTQAALETVGFRNVEFRPMHASDTLDVMLRDRRLDPHIAGLIFGPQDYAALAVRT